MASSINVNQNNNKVTLQDQNGKIIVTDNNKNTSVNVTSPSTKIVTVSTLGPQGPPWNGTLTGSINVSGSSNFDGNITASGNISASGYISASQFIGNFTGSLLGTSSFALTASYVENAQTASYVLNAVSSSFALTASYVENAQTASYVENAQTASYIENAQTASYVENAQTASYVENAQTASYVETSQTASYVETSQTASYILASNIDQPFTNITASGNISASGTIVANKIKSLGSEVILENGHITASGNISASGTGSFYELELDGLVKHIGDTNTQFGFVQNDEFSVTTAGVEMLQIDGTGTTFNVNAQDRDFKVSGNGGNLFILNDGSNRAVFPTITEFRIGQADATAAATLDVAGNIFTSGSDVGHITASGNISASGYVSASQFIGSFSGSIDNANTASYVENAQTASYVETSQTASFITASNVYGPNGANSIITSSFSQTSSYVENAQTASFITSPQTNAINFTGGITASNITASSIEAFNLRVIHLTSSFITSSTIQTTGSTVFGDEPSDSHEFIGGITGSNNISASGNLIINEITASGKISTSGQLHGNDLFLNVGSFDIQTGNTYTFNPSSGTGNVEFEVGSDDVIIKTNKRLELQNTQGRLELGSISAPTNVTMSGNISGSAISTGSFGHIIGDFSGSINNAINATSSSLAGCSDKIKTKETTDNTTFFPAFVDSNNPNPTCEDVFTTPIFTVNPAERVLTFAGKIVNKGSSITLESGSISASAGIAVTGSISSSAGSIIADAGTGSFGHIITDSGSLEFRDPVTKNITGKLSFQNNGGLQVKNSKNLSTDMKVGKITISTPGDISNTIDIVSGSINLSANITASGNISGSARSTGSFGHIIGTLSGSAENALTASYVLASNIDQPFTNVTASGNISASGKLFVNKIENIGQLKLGDPDGNSNASRIIIDNPNTLVSIKNADLDLGEGNGGVPCNVTLTGNITSSGNITASVYEGAFFKIPSGSGQNAIQWGSTYNSLLHNYIFFGNISNVVRFQASEHQYTNTTGDQAKVRYGAAPYSWMPGAPSVAMEEDLFVGSHITASGNISSSGTGSFKNVGIGTNNPEQLLHIKGSTPRIRVEAAANGTPSIELKNNQSPDFTLKNVFSDGGFQIASTGGPAKPFVTIGASDGDVIELSGSVNVTGTNGNITASGDISASGEIIASNFVMSQNTNGIQFRASNGNLFNNILTNASDDFIVQNLKNGENLRLRAGQSGNKGQVLIQQGGTTTGIASFGPTSQIEFNGDITASNNISGSAVGTISSGTGSFHVLTGDTTQNTGLFVDGSITASGAISASGDIHGFSYQIQGKSGITYNDANDRIIYGQNNQNSRLRGTTITLGDDATQHVTASGKISSSGGFEGSVTASGGILLKSGNSLATISGSTTSNLYIGRRYYSTPSSATYPNNFNGDFVNFGLGPSGNNINFLQGRIYMYRSTGYWELADASTAAEGNGLLAINTVVGKNLLMTKGISMEGTWVGLTVGAPLFLSEIAGTLTTTRPTTTNAIVRVVGYCIDATNRIIYFNPDSTYVTV